MKKSCYFNHTKAFMKKIFIVHCSLFIVHCLLTGCDIIKPEDRFIPITGRIMSEKRVLLVEFTDQNCKNCLYATAEIERLTERFSDTIVVVSIHSNPLPFPLRTSEGNEYEQHFKAEDHPAGIVDGGTGKYMSHDPQAWGGFILERLKEEPALMIDMAVYADSADNETTVSVYIEGIKALSDIKLQLWIIENNIEQWQLMLDGTRNDNYLHNHVFRSSINGTWGESFSIEAAEKKEFIYHFTLQPAWKQEDMTIVCFVYYPDTDEIINVQQISLLTKI